MLMRSLLIAALAFVTAPASAQFYKDKTLTLLINYGVGGNADTEARVFQRHLVKYIPGRPTIIMRNVPGAGGANAMNQLGLNIASQADGLTVGGPAMYLARWRYTTRASVSALPPAA